MRLIRVLTVVCLLAACGGPSSPAPATERPLTKLVVTCGSINGDDLPLWVAIEANIFKQNGLDVDLQLASSSSAAITAVLSGQAQVTQTGGSDAVSAAVGGAQVVVVTTTSPVYSYLFEVPANIKTPQDLKGKRVGVSSPGSSADVGTRVALRKVGLDPDKDVTIVRVGDVPTRAAALVSGAIQGTVLNPPETRLLETQGFHPLFDLAALKLPAVLQTAILQRSYAASNQETVQRYVDSIVQAVARMRKDKAFTVGVLKKYFKSDDDPAMAATYDFYVGEVIAIQPFPKPELFADAIAELSRKNEKVRGFDARTIIDASFVQKTVDRGLAKP